MKMAKALPADLEAALAVSGIVESLERGFLPDELYSEGKNYFDGDDREQCRRVVRLILDKCRNASLFRVSFGMQVLLDPANKLLDPNARTLEAHPEIERGAVLLGELLCELKSAHQIIRNALNLMTTEQKTAWGMANVRDSVDGEGITRANERSEAIVEASAWVLRLTNQPAEEPKTPKLDDIVYGPDNPPRLRKNGESVEEYHAAMGWETKGGAA